MFMKSLCKVTILLAFCSLAACNQYSDGLVGDFQETSKCPANGCANQNANENYISLDTKTSVINVTGGNPITIGGDCYASTFPTNTITATVTYQTSGAPVAAAVSSNTGSSQTPACRKGRFEVTIDTRNLPASNVYSVRLELVAYDANNTPHRNAASGFKTITLRK